MRKNICILHSCTIDDMEILVYLVEYLYNKKLLEKMEFLYINNIGKQLDEKVFSKFGNNIIITNYSTNTNTFENDTLKMIHFYSQLHVNKNILYLHTKGITWKADPYIFQNIRNWVDFMLYCLVDHSTDCIKMLNKVDVVGCLYWDEQHGYGFPNHYSGNFWWTRVEYIKTLNVESLNNKSDAEFWLFKNQPSFINIHTPKYYNPYHTVFIKEQYQPMIKNRILNFLNMLKNIKTVKIFYGTKDITEICHQKLVLNNKLYIPAGYFSKSKLFIDTVPLMCKNIKIGEIEFLDTESICLPF